MALLGDLVVRLDADSQKFERGMQRSSKQLAKFEKSSLATALSGKKFKSSLTQMSFATDDFFGVLAAGGGAGAAIRSTANNFGTMVTMINPLAGLVTSVGIALGSVLIPKLFGTGDAADKATDGLDKMSAALERAEEEQRKLEQFTVDSSRIRGLFDEKSIDAEILRVKRELEGLQDQRGVHVGNLEVLGFDGDAAPFPLEKDIERLNNQLERLAVNKGLAEFNQQIEQLGRIEDIADITSLDTLTGKIDESRDALAKMQREMQAIGRNLAILEDIDPTGKLPEFDEIFREQDRRAEAMRDLRKEIEAIENRKQQILSQGIQLGSDLPGGEDFNAKIQKLEAEADKLRNKFALDIETDPAQRSLAQITQEFERQMEQIREKFDGAQESELLALAEQARQSKIDQVLEDAEKKQNKLDAKRDTNAGFAQRGTTEAFSAILKATRGGGDSQSLASIAKATVATAKSNEKIAKAAEKKAQPKPAGEKIHIVESLL